MPATNPAIPAIPANSVGTITTIPPQNPANEPQPAKRRLVCGVGINDADYPIERTDSSGKRVTCPIYITWTGMLRRCYSLAWHAKRPSYTGCSVVPEWHKFSAFRNWMIQQAWEGQQLDKDLLSPGNKVYGPEHCVFVSSMVNSFVVECTASRGEWPIGVSWCKRRGKFLAYCSNPFTKRLENLGYHVTPEAAHAAWLARKLELARELAAVQTDARVAKALVERYEKYNHMPPATETVHCGDDLPLAA